MADSVSEFIQKARREPIGVDVSDYGDEWVQGFLAGQASILEEIDREPNKYGIAIAENRAHTFLAPEGGKEA